MTDRERFEAWAEHLMLERQGDGYVSHYTNHAFRAWQASRKQALEEAWRACYLLNGSQSEYASRNAFVLSREKCVNAVRALANPEGEQG
jgi:hypothetical protein